MWSKQKYNWGKVSKYSVAKHSKSVFWMIFNHFLFVCVVHHPPHIPYWPHSWNEKTGDTTSFLRTFHLRILNPTLSIVQMRRRRKVRTRTRISTTETTTRTSSWLKSMTPNKSQPPRPKTRFNRKYCRFGSHSPKAFFKHVSSRHQCTVCGNYYPNFKTPHDCSPYESRVNVSENPRVLGNFFLLHTWVFFNPII